jgi:hypothetical protein
VAVTGRKAEKNTEMSQELGEAGAAFTLDVRDEAAVEQTIAQVVGEIQKTWSGPLFSWYPPLRILSPGSRYP